MKLRVSVLVLSLASLLAAEEAAGPVVTPYGMVQYRFREEIKMKSTDGAPDSSLTNYANTVGYKFGSKIKVNDKVSFQFEIANDWNANEAVNLATWNYMGRRGGLASTTDKDTAKIKDIKTLLFPYFTLANVTYDAGSYHLSAGVIGLQSTAASALFAASLIQGKKYDFAAHIPWATATNGGIPGFKAGAPIIDGDLKLGVDVTTSILEERAVPYSSEDPVTSASSAVLLNLDIPMSTGALTLCPQVFLVTDRNFRDAGSENMGDMEVIGGVEAGYKLSDGVSLRGGIGIGMVSNLETEESPGQQYDRQGVNGAAGASIKAGPGKVEIDVSATQTTDATDTTKDMLYPFFDLKYGYSLNKNFVVMPRVRVFVTSAEASSLNHIRPEMILTGSF